MKKIIISMLSIFTLSLLLCDVFAEAKTSTGTTSRPRSNYTKPSITTPKTSPSNPSSSSTTDTMKEPSSFSSFTSKYPNSSRYFAGDVLSKTLLLGTTILMLNDIDDEEPTYEDEEGNVYTLADLEEMDVHIPEEEPVEEELYSETVTFDETEAETPVSQEIETASSNENYEIIEDESYNKRENQIFNWVWSIVLITVAGVVAIAFLRRTKK